MICFHVFDFLSFVNYPTKLGLDQNMFRHKIAETDKIGGEREISDFLTSRKKFCRNTSI